MRDLKIVEYAAFAPGTCMVCGRNEGPFLDTGVDIVGDGRMYLCVTTCLRIACEKAGLTVSIVSTGAVQCSAVKKNGERCTGSALPKHHTCVAHTRVKEAV